MAADGAPLGAHTTAAAPSASGGPVMSPFGLTTSQDLQRLPPVTARVPAHPPPENDPVGRATPLAVRTMRLRAFRSRSNSGGTSCGSGGAHGRVLAEAGQRARRVHGGAWRQGRAGGRAARNRRRPPALRTHHRLWRILGRPDQKLAVVKAHPAPGRWRRGAGSEPAGPGALRCAGAGATAGAVPPAAASNAVTTRQPTPGGLTRSLARLD